MTSILNAALYVLAFAGAVIQLAYSIVKRFVTENTPESALLAALAVAYQQYQAGNTGAAVAAAVGALIAFIATENIKDAVTIKAQYAFKATQQA